MAASLLDTVSGAFLPSPPPMVGVAVSGGSDSMALLHLLHEFCEIHDIALHAVTVDHRLRPEAADEAAQVAARCAEIGVSHDTLVWEDWCGRGNMQDAARRARYAKMTSWAAERGIDTIAVGHTADDQAETVLMRLARRSGVDGLSAMHHRTLRNGINWVRPLLRARRDTLRHYLRQRDIVWHDDPANDDDRYDRIKARKALELLAPLGIDADALSEVAEHMAQSRKALDWHTFLAARHVFTIEAGAVVLDEASLRLQPEEVQRRLMVKAITWISGGIYAPRRAALARVMTMLREGQATTLNGCHIRRIGLRIWIFRELNAVAGLKTSTRGKWDDRWIVTPKDPAQDAQGLTVRALGLAGLEQCGNWRGTRRPHVVLQSTPGVWRGDRLLSAPLAGFDGNWQIEPVESPDTFFAALLSH